MPIRDWLIASGSKYPGNASRNPGRPQQTVDLGTHRCSEVNGSRLHFRNERRAAINDGDQILQIVTSEEVPFARHLNVSSLVAMKNGPVTMRISRSSESLSVTEDSIAARYQRLENPRIFSSSGITSSVVP